MSKPGKVLRTLCKKLGVRLTVKRGQKRVYKSIAVLKRQCKKKVKKKKVKKKKVVKKKVKRKRKVVKKKVKRKRKVVKKKVKRKRKVKKRRRKFGLKNNKSRNRNNQGGGRRRGGRWRGGRGRGGRGRGGRGRGGNNKQQNQPYPKQIKTKNRFQENLEFFKKEEKDLYDKLKDAGKISPILVDEGLKVNSKSLNKGKTEISYLYFYKEENRGGPEDTTHSLLYNVEMNDDLLQADVDKYKHFNCVQVLSQLYKQSLLYEHSVYTGETDIKKHTAGFIILNDKYLFGYGQKIWEQTVTIDLHVETSLIIRLYNLYINGSLPDNNVISSIRVYTTLQPCCMCSLFMHQFIAKIKKDHSSAKADCYYARQDPFMQNPLSRRMYSLMNLSRNDADNLKNLKKNARHYQKKKYNYSTKIWYWNCLPSDEMLGEKRNYNNLYTTNDMFPQESYGDDYVNINYHISEGVINKNFGSANTVRNLYARGFEPDTGVQIIQATPLYLYHEPRGNGLWSIIKRFINVSTFNENNQFEVSGYRPRPKREVLPNMINNGFIIFSPFLKMTSSFTPLPEGKNPLMLRQWSGSSVPVINTTAAINNKPVDFTDPVQFPLPGVTKKSSTDGKKKSMETEQFEKQQREQLEREQLERERLERERLERVQFEQAVDRSLKDQDGKPFSRDYQEGKESGFDDNRDETKDDYDDILENVNNPRRFGTKKKKRKNKISKNMKQLCKKLGIRLTIKRGQKRVYKSIAVLKAQCLKKKRKVKKKKKKVVKKKKKVVKKKKKVKKKSKRRK